MLPSALCDINSQTSTPPSQPSTNTSGFVSGAPTSGSGSGGSGMSGSAAYYINESMSESSGDSLNNSNNGNNNLAKTLHQMRNGINEAGRLNGIGMKGNYQIFIKFSNQETMYKLENFLIYHIIK